MPELLAIYSVFGRGGVIVASSNGSVAFFRRSNFRQLQIAQVNSTTVLPEVVTDQTTILVPIRYPLTAESSRTLAAAGRLAAELAPATLTVLHVNLYQNGDHTQTTDLTRAITASLPGVQASVTTRQGFLVEREILEEARQIDADVIVVGATQQPRWKRLLRRLLRDTPPLETYLLEQTTGEIDVMEVDTTGDSPTAVAV